MASRRKDWVGRTVVALLLALAAHGAVLIVAVWVGALDALMPHPGGVAGAPARPAAGANADERPIEVESLVDQLSRPDEKTPEEQKREEQAKKEEEDKSPHGQVIDLAKPAIEERPDHAEYVSEYDSKVDHETRGAHGRDQAGGRQAFVPPQGRPDVSAPAPGGAGTPAPASKPGRPGPLAMRELDQQRPTSRAKGENASPGGDLEHAGSPSPGSPAPRPSASGDEGEGGARAAAGSGARPGLPQGKPNLLAPPPDLLQHAIGKGAGSMDYLKDVDDGESTALNSKRWKHAEFFNRIKRAVAHEWHPESVYMIHDASGHVYGFKDRVTVLRIHLSPDGKLAAWQILQASGVDFLDDEAVSAFRKAQPFPNPPAALVESDGQIHFNFAFIFELSGRGSVKVFKYR